jgi:hypothetical protein
MTQAMRTLLSGLIDYAGLFPPAKLGMQEAVECFARNGAGNFEWVQGRFICPASRLQEFSRAAAPLMPGTHATSGYPEHADIAEPWRVSVIIDGRLEDNLRAIAAFNDHHASEDHGQAAVDAVEVRASDAQTIEDALEVIPDEIFPFFELPVAMDCRGLIAALSGTASAAKVRTGGVTPEAFPTSEQLAAFLVACAAADVPLKATAGLHHPVRAEYPLTYEPGCARATMHGFLNVFLAAAFVRMRHIDGRAATAILENRDPSLFKITDEGVRWHDQFLETTQLAQVRESFALSYGSCSFEEPINELKGLGLL